MKSVDKLSVERTAQVNEKIDDLCNMWQSWGRENAVNLKSLDFKPLKGKSMLPSTHECDAWSDQDTRRIYMHMDGSTLVLDNLGKALH